jgi:hypothetical protein
MRRPKVYTHFTKRNFRSELTTCLTCGTRLRRYATLAQRTVITLDGPIRVTHTGYRCPDPACPTQSRSYRSAAADALALPGFTFGLDFLILVGHLRLAHQRTLDQTHQAVQERLRSFNLTISRREVLYLFDAYCTLLRAAHQIADDLTWQAQVRTNGGLILSIDGIQPDKGNETIYLVRDVISGRLLAVENIRLSDTPTIKALLQPIRDLNLPVIAAISDAQESLLQAIASLWPDIPHQICQFHYLREASRPMYELDRGLRKQIRKAIQQPVRDVRAQIDRQITKLDGNEKATAPSIAELQVLDDYALAIQTALNLDGQQPFRYASLAVDDALTEIAASLERLEKGGTADWSPRSSNDSSS